MPAETTPIPKPGDIIRVRTRTWLAENVAPSAAGTIVEAVCLDDDAQGQPLQVLWDIERDTAILDEEAWKRIGEKGFDPPRQFGAYLHTLRWNCVTATRPGLFQAPFRAGIRVDPYQLEPLRKALLLPRVNLLIADDVGLGKTIEAGLIASELLLRRRVREVVVSCPPAMVQQWKEELESKFGLTFEILDREYVERVRRERGYGVNPWTTFPRFLISHRLLIDEAYAAPFRAWLGSLRPGSLLILDEAHHAAPASGSKYAIDSKITRAIRDLAPRFEHRLFLSATPPNGHSNSFRALLEILDPQRFCRGMEVLRTHLKDVMVRRLKEDVRQVLGGFPRRNPCQIDIEGLPDTAPELVLSRLLDRYAQVRRQRLENASRRQQIESALLISGLQQRLLSSVEAFARTLRVHRRTMERHWNQEIDDARVDELAREIEGADLDADKRAITEEELEAARERQEDLQRQVKLLQNRADEARQWIGFAEDALRDAVSCSLEIMGAEPLQPLPTPDGEPQRFAFPNLGSRQGGDGSWTATLDTLRHPDKKGLTCFQWRKSAPLRPVVFQAPNQIDDSVVQVHLHHRVIQRPLSRFLSQGFIHHDLSRACLANTQDGIPRVILLGRLALYGKNASRLHEEILTVTARWTPPDRRSGKLVPYARDAEARTLDLLEEGLKPGRTATLADDIQKALAAAIPRDIEELLPHLEAGGAQARQDAEKALRERGDLEARHMRKILEEQKKRIATKLGQDPQQQLSLFTHEEERRQYEADRKYLEFRHAKAQEELVSEPERVREYYQVRSYRLQPIGIAYLHPPTLDGIGGRGSTARPHREGDFRTDRVGG